MKQLYSAIVGKVYESIFGEKITPRIHSFAADVGIVAVGFGAANALNLVFQVLAGRILGPEEYGKFSLVQSVAMLLYVPMLLGFNTAVVKYCSEKEDTPRQTNIISTAYIIVVALVAISSVVYFLCKVQLERLFCISGDLFRLAVIFAILYTFYTFVTDTARGLFKMKILAVFQSAGALVILLAFLMFIITRNVSSLKSAIYAYLLAYGIVSIILPVIFLRRHFGLSLSREWAGTLGKYSLLAAVGSIAYAIYTNIDKILINEYMTASDLGIYKAYYQSSIGMASLFSIVFNTVFFPSASMHENKKDIFNKITKLIPYVITGGILVIFVCEFLVLKLYGSEYSMNIPLMLMFALASDLIIWYGLYDWTFCSEGIRGLKLINIGTAAIAVLSVSLNKLLVPVFGLYGAISSVILSFTAGLICVFLLKKKLVYE